MLPAELTHVLLSAQMARWSMNRDALEAYAWLHGVVYTELSGKAVNRVCKHGVFGGLVIDGSFPN